MGKKILPFGGAILSSCRNLLLLRGTTLSIDPPLGHLLFALSLGTETFPAALSLRGVDLPLREKAIFLEVYSLNLHVSFSLGAVNLPHGEVVLSTPFSLRETYSFFGEFVLPFGENFLSFENWLYQYVPYSIPFIKFLLDRGSIQTTTHSFFNLLTRIRQYLGTHTFLGESFIAFLDYINALRLKLAMLIEAIGGKRSSLIAIAYFLSGNLSIPLLILSCMTFLKPQHALIVWFHELWYLQ